ncbi:hypothetical protein TI39_contig4262g00009 [Zymoseptoria brevis]|uniref:R3H-associated N-terminal domain-containing protein n=1 Tax=Zymoseptoria brevis TaxID=1047168 RepID=A0A0F4G8S0_9PEZI|nr:hypothetical protein TI39_contig4262g00009 [Zymoseptoria brevis]
MAIFPELHPEPSSIERVDAWAVTQLADALSGTAITSPPPRQARTVTIEIPLDEREPIQDESTRLRLRAARPEPVHTVYKRSEPIRRDSLKRRESLLKGKEGSRRRQRWENDRLLNNPHAEPPLPSDWQPHPTYAVQNVPYFLAPLWDAEYARKSQERQARAAAAKAPASKEEAAAAKVAQDLRAKMKRAKGAKGLLQDLEDEVRTFVRQWEEKERQLEGEGLIEPDSEDEEIVFVGRGGAITSDERREERHLEKDKLIYQGLIDDHGAAFGRYLTHQIAIYYGLKTWSITKGGERLAYVGLKIDPKTRRPSLSNRELPRPLYAVV